jgi:molybdopterin molybdotransferase
MRRSDDLTTAPPILPARRANEAASLRDMPTCDLPSALSIADARALILSFITPLSTEQVMLAGACGRVLAEPIHSPTDWPRFDLSAMDGFAVRAQDTLHDPPLALTLTGARFAGDAAPAQVDPRHAMLITTGALLPAGADAVLMREDARVSASGDAVEALVHLRPGANIRKQGEDFRAGAPLLSRSLLLDPGAVGLLASIGRAQVTVYRRPRVAIVSSGDELVDLGQPAPQGKLINSTPYMLRALLLAAGADPVIVPHACDLAPALRAAMIEASRCADLIVSVGGISTGERDLVRDAVTRQPGSAVHFWRVTMKPGKPLAAGNFLGKPWIGLPGNPVSSAVTAWLFLLPALMKARGLPQPWSLPTIDAQLCQPLRARSRVPELIRGRLRFDGGHVCFDPHPNQAPGDISSVSSTCALYELPPNTTSSPGDLIRVSLLTL